MKLFAINGAHMKVFGKSKMDYYAVLSNTG